MISNGQGSPSRHSLNKWGVHNKLVCVPSTMQRQLSAKFTTSTYRQDDQHTTQIPMINKELKLFQKQFNLALLNKGNCWSSQYAALADTDAAANYLEKS